MSEINKAGVMLTIKETAKAWNLPVTAVRRFIAEKKVAFIKIGKKFLINQESVAEYLKKGDNA